MPKESKKFLEYLEIHSLKGLFTTPKRGYRLLKENGLKRIEQTLALEVDSKAMCWVYRYQRETTPRADHREGCSPLSSVN